MPPPLCSGETEARSSEVMGLRPRQQGLNLEADHSLASPELGKLLSTCAEGDIETQDPRGYSQGYVVG